MRSFIFSVLLLSIISCKKENVIVDPGNKDYLPMQTGNKWEFEFDETKEIIGTKTIDGKLYYSLKSNYDTSFYRIENTSVYVKAGQNEPEALIFKLGAAKNDIWDYNSYKVKMVSRTDTVVINNQKISPCLQFFFDIPQAVDEEHSIWLAPGIGFIQEQCGECMHPVRKLKKAKINGDEVNI